MYYQEKWINGLLFFKTTPDGNWKPFSIEKYAERVKEMEQERNKLWEKINELENQLKDE